LPHSSWQTRDGEHLEVFLAVPARDRMQIEAWVPVEPRLNGDVS
jgi:hypothetical protein